MAELRSAVGCASRRGRPNIFVSAVATISDAHGLSPSAQRQGSSTDRCIDDISRLAAITGSPSSKILARRLLNIPGQTGIYSTKTLPSLSTAMRARCLERLTDHTSDWLIVNEDVSGAQWQRLILLSGGHGSLIEDLATGLDRSNRQHMRIIRRERTADLRALLEAYLRVAQGARRLDQTDLS